MASRIQEFAILVVLATFLQVGSGDLIGSTCKTTPNYQLCSSILRNDPRSRGADVAGLALIMIDSFKSKSNSAIRTIDRLIGTLPKLKAPLAQCKGDYQFVLKYDVPVAVEAVTKGDPKFGEDSMTDAERMVQQCEDRFKPKSSPLTKINTVNRDVAAVAAAIIRLLL